MCLAWLPEVIKQSISSPEYGFGSDGGMCICMCVGIGGIPFLQTSTMQIIFFKLLVKTLEV